MGGWVGGWVDRHALRIHHPTKHDHTITQNPTPQNKHPASQHEAGEKRAASLQERRKQLTALQTNLARDRQEVAALEKEIVRGA